MFEQNRKTSSLSKREPNNWNSVWQISDQDCFKIAANYDLPSLIVKLRVELFYK
ncbi:hypothetical protein [Limosilactobacillus reuteri]|nr:hypothetical protein [Limosilactobacillus reuteri]